MFFHLNLKPIKKTNFIFIIFTMIYNMLYLVIKWSLRTPSNIFQYLRTIIIIVEVIDFFNALSYEIHGISNLIIKRKTRSPLKASVSYVYLRHYVTFLHLEIFFIPKGQGFTVFKTMYSMTKLYLQKYRGSNPWSTVCNIHPVLRSLDVIFLESPFIHKVEVC